MKCVVIVSACLPAVGCALFLGGCATITKPVALIGQHGEILRGTNTWSPGGSSIGMTNGKTTTSGSYDAWGQGENDTTRTFPLRCSDGRTGIATLTLGGGGEVRFSDGTEGDFIVGEGARGI